MILLNSLTPVFFVGVYQLFLGNLVLGLLESFLITRIFKQNPSYSVIIIANYVSAIVGYGVSNAILDPTDLNIVRGYENGTFPQSMFAYTSIAYCVTLLVEFPFYYWGVKNKDKSRLSIGQLTKEIIIIHVISYLVTILTWLLMVLKS